MRSIIIVSEFISIVARLHCNNVTLLHLVDQFGWLHVSRSLHINVVSLVLFILHDEVK